MLITLEDIEKVVRDCTKSLVNEMGKKSPIRSVSDNYRLSANDELFEYMWLKPRVTGLNVDIFVDDGGSFIRNGHRLLLFIRNGYNRQDGGFIPMSIEEHPRVLDDEMDFNIRYNDIFDVQDFIQANLNSLAALANRKISQEEFVSSINRVPAYSLSESRLLLNEMATLRADDSGLPVDIWLDEGGLYQGHAPRIKFRASNEQRTTHEFSSMLITNPPTIENMPKNSPIRAKDIETLKSFVVANLNELLALANGNIDYLSEFKPNMKIPK